ncbi:uncharacterized protein AKAME5_001335600 [Lates japonicus]|uniref:Uncharacterized protein n=1 Tax=Lates japonicus TaxID=270547 RepID=A0AAD3RAZ0_LATJO|nr:uncharacterized protein AKAME5_001335600 [Lates japonicus]
MSCVEIKAHTKHCWHKEDRRVDGLANSKLTTTDSPTAELKPQVTVTLTKQKDREINKVEEVKMPAGVSWPRYLRMFSASVLAMFAGAQVVHQYYLPDLSIPEIPPKPGELQTELRGYKVREEAAAAFQQLKAEQKVD